MCVLNLGIYIKDKERQRGIGKENMGMFGERNRKKEMLILF